ncbi:NlpC/P60 family protein [Blastococcus jejuensis]|uniref:NlpC/P60 family protein n=1 Tax=Blastococcus jejuensis TaxID=351224 RepID=A0ABP6NYJ5_9ACTN
MDSGTRSTIARALVAGVLAVGLSVGVAAAPAAAAPGSIADAQRTADELEARIGELNQTLADAQAAADAAHAASAIALDDYQATQAAYQAAQQRAEVAAADAAAATASLGVAREDVVAFARRSYMQGSTYPEVAALLTAADPSQLIERAALLEAAGSHRSDVLDTVTVLQEQAARADVVARTAVVEADQLQAAAAAALEVAQAAEVSARDQAATVAAEQAGLETELAAVQEELRDLVGAQEAAERAAAVTPPPAAPPAGPPPASSGDDTPAGPGNSSAAQTAIDAAMRYLGTPYAWGGGGRNGPGPGLAPDEGVIGFDCSGLTQYAYAQAGISIPRNSRAQYAALPKVSADDLQPGDLVFWASNPGNPATIHHVAIYLGNGRIVQAPESGDVVKVSNMWWAGYAGAVRPSA